MHIIFIYNPFHYVISKYWTELWCNHIDSSIILNWNWCSKTSSTKKYTFYDWIAKHCINFVPDRIHCASLQCLDIQIIPDICIGHLSYSVRACMFASCKNIWLLLLKWDKILSSEWYDFVCVFDGNGNVSSFA